MAKGKPLTDEDIAALVGARVRPCTGYADTTLSREREELQKYYDAREPAPLHRGNSKYVSQDVYDSVEMAKAILLETFTGNDRPVRFIPLGQDDVKPAQIATEYVNHVVFVENNGYEVFHDVIHDGLMNRNGIAQVLWKTDKEEVEERLNNVSMEEVSLIFQALTQKGVDIEPKEIVTNDDGSLDITYIRRVDASRVVIEAVPAEEFGMTPRAKSIASAPVVFRRQRITRSELLKDPDYDAAVVKELPREGADWNAQDPEVQQRHYDTDDGFEDLDGPGEAEETVMVYTVFTRLDIEGAGTSKLYKIIYAGGKVLHKEPCRRKPFITYTPLRRPHSAWGSPFAKRVIATQNARTMLTRAIIDHALITTNPRHTVVRGSLVNPKELLENRLGGVVNVTRPDAILPLQNAPLNPFVLQTIGLLDDDKEKDTGVSRLSQGLNKDAISKQNSADLVQSMVTVSQQRTKIMARNMAYGFVSDLFLLVYQLALENQKREKIVQIAGEWVPIDPQDWRERNSVHVEFHLGFEEKNREFNDLVQIDQYFRQAPGLQPQYGPEQQWALISRALALKGIKDPATFLLPPDKVPPQQPDPMLMKKVELEERKVAADELRAQSEAQKVQLEQSRKMGETQLKAAREAHKVESDQDKLRLSAQDRALAQDEFQHQQMVDAAELALKGAEIDVKAEAARNRAEAPRGYAS